MATVNWINKSVENIFINDLKFGEYRKIKMIEIIAMTEEKPGDLRRHPDS